MVISVSYVQCINEKQLVLKYYFQVSFSFKVILSMLKITQNTVT